MAADQYRDRRLTALRAAQNSDGGWGYFPGKDSWLEPTCYALLALHQHTPSQDAFQRGWSLMRSWQLPDGSWRPSAKVQNASWVTALCVTLHCARGAFDSSFDRGVNWLIGVKGTEGGWFERLVNVVRPLPNEYDRRFRGWPWNPETSSWVEPTAHSILALKKAIAKAPASAARQRIDEAEQMLLDRRSVDGGWNYGNRRVLKTDLPSYPETTALALLGLQGSERFDASAAVDLAGKFLNETRSPAARAWLAIALRNYGKPVPEEQADTNPSKDNMLTALELLACSEGGHQWLKPVKA